MHVHANNESLGVSKYINLAMLFYLINNWLGNEIFDDFNKVVDIVIKKVSYYVGWWEPATEGDRQNLY